ncbi:MAG: hypothetical protein ABI690_11395 [Chloroflexota bacterium]
MINQNDTNLLRTLIQGVRFEFVCPVSAEECIALLEADLSHLSAERKRKRKRLIVTPINSHSYEFQFKKTRLNRTYIAYVGNIENRSNNQSYLTGHAKIDRINWIVGPAYPMIFAAALLPFIPLVTLLIGVFVFLWILTFVNDCKNSPQMLYELINSGGDTKAKVKKK